ncbi:ABC transporter permease [Chitinasiproducens palmae]|uniref:Transport permease protein n=1 Tax=Chitinasiproducens palmae TaxID=1770053 RepID=A0A1H2PTC4_9BURK|nr:ABC transporter permease [Chitinasiproducens palmae]SDV49910.1 lipooligosaccharide transport system permease protein [Chitinasiproducens palmae]
MTTSVSAILPSSAVTWVHVWRRNFLVWRKLALPSMLGNLADPMIYLFGLGFGLGMMVGQVDGVPYIAFLAAGTVASSVMMSASFESLYSAFSRMHEQRTWDALMHTPLTLGDVLFGEVCWAASKATLSGVAIMIVASALGLTQVDGMLIAVPAVVLAGFAFACIAIVVTALAPGYDFFMFYQTLLLTPMMLLSGVFFPRGQLPQIVQTVSACLPLHHAISLIRPALLGRPVEDGLLHVAVLLGYAVVGLSAAALLLRRRLLG